MFIDDVLGLTIAPINAEPALYRLQDEQGAELLTGTHPACQRKRLKALIERHGDGQSLLRVPTLGGKQLWSDEFVSCGWRIQRHCYSDQHRLLDASDLWSASGSYEACRVAFEQARLQHNLAPRSTHAVVLLHGLGRSKDAMGALAQAFAENACEVINVNYPSTRAKLEEHAAQIHRILSRLWGISTVSFVTHSMGGIVARTALGDPDPQPPWRHRLHVHRLLMIFPPSQGAAAAQKWRQVGIARQIMGPPLDELSPENADAIPVPNCPFAIIGGTRDRRVSLEEAKLPGAEAFFELDVEHTFGMRHPEVLKTALNYIVWGGPDGAGNHGGHSQ